MHNTATHTQPVTVSAARAGQVISVLVGAFLLFDAVIHMLAIGPVVESFRDLGFSGSQALPIGIVELVCLALYAVPRTSLLGAVLLTGYLGGAVCAHFRAESPLFSTTLFPVYVGIAIWAGLYLRDERVRALVRGA
jgi:DoxX-like protein